VSRAPEEPAVDEGDPEDDEHLQLTVEQWPQIDPVVESVVNKVDKVDRYLQQAAVATLARVGLSYQEFKVLISLHAGQRSHGWLCRELLVSTGAMTNRLDKLEEAGLVERSRDPNDRRGVLLALTAAGRAKLDEYIELGADRERQLLGVLESGEQRQLDRLLRKLYKGLRAELGSAPPVKARLTS
jgi:DNA-binding MarR family transcriptional regulator